MGTQKFFVELVLWEWQLLVMPLQAKLSLEEFRAEWPRHGNQVPASNMGGKRYM